MAINLDVLGNTSPLEAQVQAAINRIRKTPIRITVDDKGATQPLGNMRRGADEFTKSMEAANARILAFGASMAIINGVADAFKGMVRNVVEVEKSLADINVVMGLSAKNLEAFGDGLFKVAKETASAFNIAAEAATEYARQGLSMEESLKRTKDALILTRLTGMDSAEAVKSLTAAMNTYGSEIKDTTQLVSKFAAVDVQFAVSAEDFADAISRTGAAARGAGVDIDELIGIVTAAQQQTARGGKVIGNSLKTIFTRVGRTDTLNQLENLGIAVRDVEGNTLGAKRILTDLANTFDKLTEAQKAQIAQTVGGVFQINILKAILGDAAKQNGILANATQISASATDEAIQKNQELNSTLSALISQTGSAIKQASANIGEIALAPGMEKILNTVKSISEGINSMFGDGENTGNKFATGFLKGIGNIITGPGLAVITVVFLKLAGQAVKFAKDSLSSLIGVTSEAQKQKAIQASLVGLFSQNAALSKEMLRTDISRTEKEKVILGLLQAQVAEANMLNRISKQAASTLYSRGYGASLTPVRRGRAEGHIPNFAHPERMQAAKGGYAAGSIRSMNMPGEGSIIYNSAETVKNFAGFKQPAIMPPQSSKAGKNYQQAFGDIHGFDPYAAGGYIPNYALSAAKAKKMIEEGKNPQGWNTRRDLDKDTMDKARANALKNKTKVTNASDVATDLYLNPNSVSYIGLSASLGPDSPKQTFYIAGGARTDSGIYESAKQKGFQKAREDGTYGAKVDVEFLALDSSDKQRGYAKMDDEINTALQEKSESILNKILTRFDRDPMQEGNKSKDLPLNKMATVSGHIFEALTKTILRQVGAGASITENPGELIDLKPNDQLYEFFGMKEGEKKGQKGAEVKINAGGKNPKSFARKIYTLGVKGLPAKTQAYGFIPNFADPLSDAIGREKAAGVPVSQIRVGSHGALMSKGNPLGLGVTNTKDEPNGLRDVFGANGFVPNYALVDQSAASKVIGRLLDKWKSITSSVLSYEQKRELVLIRGTTNSAKESAEDMKQLGYSKKQTQEGMRQLGYSQQETAEAMRQAGFRSPSRGVRGFMGRASSRFERTGPGRAMGSTGGQMAIMMGLPMAAGFLQENFSGPAGRYGGSALTGAATGASIGMMFGPLGTAIGAGVGALGGFVGALMDSKDAIEEKAEAEKKAAQEVAGSLAAVLMQFPESRENLKAFTDRFSVGFKDLEEAKQNKMTQRRSGPTINYSQVEKATNLTDKLSSDVESNIGDLLKTLPDDFIFSAKTFKKDDEGKSVVADFEGTGKEYIKEFSKSSPAERITMFQSLAKAMRAEDERVLREKKKQAEGLIIQLNIQKAQLAAQQASALKQLEIKDTYSAISDNLKNQLKLAGSFATDQFKAQNKYLQSLNKAEEAFSLSQASADSQLRTGLLNAIKGDENIQSVVKTKLGMEKTGSFRDISNKVGSLTGEDLRNKLREIADEEGDGSAIRKAILETIDLELIKRQNILELAEKQRTNSQAQAGREKRINDILAERKKVLDDLRRTDRIADEATRSAQKIRGFDDSVAKARRLTAVGAGFQSAEDKERFQILEKEFEMESKLATLEENKANKDRELGIERKEIDMLNERQEELKKLKDNISTSQYDDFKEELEELKTLKSLETERKEKLEEINQKIQNANTEHEKEIESLNVILALEKERIQQDRLERTGPGAFQRGLEKGTRTLREQAEYMNYELGQNIPRNFADGLASAMTQALKGAKDLDDALIDTAINFLGTIQQALMQQAAYSLVGGMGFMKNGGPVRNYSRGGKVPAMVTNGEYVMNPSAVNKYGGAFMHTLNSGSRMPEFYNGGSTMKKFGTGGAVPGSAIAAGFGGGKHVVSGRAYQSQRMSGYFYSGQAGNVGLKEDESALMGVLAQEERERQKKLQKKAKRRALIQQLIGTAASFGISYMMGGFGNKSIAGTKDALKIPAGSKIEGSYLKDALSTRNNPSAPLIREIALAPGMIPFRASPQIAGSYYQDAFNTRNFTKRAHGGMIYGRSGIDQIPAMLSEGEYVIRASSARQIGKPMLDAINAGKFNEGGSVTPMQESSDSGISGGNTNNINISINMERGKSSEQQDSSSDVGTNPAEKSKDQEDSSKLAERIKAQVVNVIVEEQRPGGLLSGKS